MGATVTCAGCGQLLTVPDAPSGLVRCPRCGVPLVTPLNLRTPEALPDDPKVKSRMPKMGKRNSRSIFGSVMRDLAWMACAVSAFVTTCISFQFIGNDCQIDRAGGMLASMFITVSLYILAQALHHLSN